MIGSRVLRWTARVLAVALVVAIAALLVVRVYGRRRLAWAESEFAKKVGSRAPATSAPVSLSGAENAALVLGAGAEAVILPGNDRPRMGALAMQPLGHWTPEDRAELDRIVANNRPALELLHRAAGMTRSDFGPLAWDNDTRELRSPPLLKLITAQRLLLVDARMASLAHEPARLLADAGSMAVMAAGLERETPMVELQVGMACEKMFWTAVQDAVSNPSIDRESLTKLEAMLMNTDLRAAWRRSNLRQQSVIQQHVAAVMSEPVTARVPKVSLYGRFVEFAFGDIFRAQQLEIRAALIAAVDQPLGLDPAWSRRGQQEPRTIFDMFDVFESVMFGPAPNRYVGRVQSTLSLRNLGRIALALRLQGLETGAYPDTLASVPGAMQPDPFAGKPPTYERRADGSARISVPDFEALWKRISDAGPATQPSTWELPAPARAVAAKHATH
jgi:hypothetical protein